jgi:hypothetical protein
LRFFLTANSRSPELNMFGLPRISIWPVHEVDNPVPSASRRSGFDDLMAFCGSIADKQYYFTRADSTSSIRDFESGTQPVPPLPGMPKRNKKLLFGVGGEPDGYLQRMGKRDIPGVGGNFNTKYSDKDPSGIHTEWERILLTMFDYIRSVNLIDTGRKEASSAGYKLAYTPGYSVTNPPNYSSGVKSVVGSGQVVPTVIRDSNNVPIMKGFGRFVNLSEVA